jgi:hypothetical protein
MPVVRHLSRKEITMSDYDPDRVDPNRVDPRRMDPKRPAVNEAGYAAHRGFNWSWVIGGIAAIVVLLVALSYMGGSSDRTAGTDQPPATTTGQSAPTQTPAPKAAPTAPTTPNATPAAPPAPRPASPNQ